MRRLALGCALLCLVGCGAADSAGKLARGKGASPTAALGGAGRLGGLAGFGSSSPSMVVSVQQRPDGGVVTRLLEDVGSEVSTVIEDRAAALTAWVEGVRIMPRFPTPLQRELGA